jgi:hypothetical protein
MSNIRSIDMLSGQRLRPQFLRPNLRIFAEELNIDIDDPVNARNGARSEPKTATGPLESASNFNSLLTHI